LHIYEKSNSSSRIEEGIHPPQANGWLVKNAQKIATIEGGQEKENENEKEMEPERETKNEYEEMDIKKEKEITRQLEDGRRMSILELKDSQVKIQENGIRYMVPIVEGQKTGFFLDHRRMRELVGKLAAGRKVLNCFSYIGAFSLAASMGGAALVTSVDSSPFAIEKCKQNYLLNYSRDTFPGPVLLNKSNEKEKIEEISKALNLSFVVEDVFQFLRKRGKFKRDGKQSSEEQDTFGWDFVILDPPAFAKRKQDVVPACRGYKDINRLVLQQVPANSFILTSSCSYYVNSNLFQQVVFQAAGEANRRVRILDRHNMAFDHPLSIYHPEGDYLKSLLLYVD
jgi:23S rRNA (cytosine1962-C5)-methyltransferase